MPPQAAKSKLMWVACHPRNNQSKDENSLREVRQFVMRNWLDKESQNPNSTDHRVNGNSRAKRQRHERTQAVFAATVEHVDQDENSDSDLTIFSLVPESILNVAVRPTSNSSSDTSKRSRMLSEEARPRLEAPSTPLMTDFHNGVPAGRYINTSFREVPFITLPTIGGGVNPFDSWPSFDDKHLDINDLKWKCALRFGSRGIVMHWVPAILQARHAFLSTICISTAHDDLMHRSSQAPEDRGLYPSLEHVCVRVEVIRMINESLDNPESRVSDGTIIAVLQLLHSEIIGCDDETMRIHQAGIQKMVEQRGGMEKLGVDGVLADNLTICMYIIATLRERPPDIEIAHFAKKCNTEITDDTKPFPESPTCFKPSGFSTIRQAIQPGDPTFDLLDLTRSLTNKFFDEHLHQTQTSTAPFRTARFLEPSESSILDVRNQIREFPQAKEVEFFTTPHDRYTYEAIRLTSMIYSHALASRLTFSRSAARLQRTSTNVTKQSNSISPLAVEIRDALMQTDLTSCWGHLSGVLLWTTLVAGAAAATCDHELDKFQNEEEEARKWLAAVAVRCAVVLGFDHTSMLLEMLKRLVDIESILTVESVDSEEHTSSVIASAVQREPLSPTFGPPELLEAVADLSVDPQQVS